MQKEIKKSRIYLIIFVVIAIAVGGLLWWKSQRVAQEITKEIGTKTEVTKPKEEKEEIDTSNWKTYVNEEEGFSMKYPEKLIVKDKDKKYIYFWTREALDNVKKGEIDFAEFTISIEENPKQISLDQWLAKKNEEIGFLYYDERTEFITSEGIKGYRLREEGSPDHYNYYYSKNQKVYVISTPLDNKDKYEEVFRTFKFE